MISADTKFFKFNNNFIAYKEYKSKRKIPTIVFLHGLMSNMEGTKAEYLHNYCQKQDLCFTRFDYLGHGKSSGKFTEQTITSWKNTIEIMLEHIIEGEFIIIASSMSGWLALLLQEKYYSRLKGILFLSPALNFTEELIWNQMSESDKNSLIDHGLIEFGPEQCKYPIAYNLIVDGRSHLIDYATFRHFTCPIYILHSKKDFEVPYSNAIKLLEFLKAPLITLKLLNEDGHNLSSQKSLSAITMILEEILIFSTNFSY